MQDEPGQHSKVMQKAIEKVGWAMAHNRTKKIVWEYTGGNQGIAAACRDLLPLVSQQTTCRADTHPQSRHPPAEQTPTCVVDVFIPAPLPPGRISSLLSRLQIFVGCEKGTGSFLRESDPFLSAGTLPLFQTLPYYLFIPRYPSLDCQ